MYVQEKGEKTPIHVLQAAAITKGLKGEELVDMETLADAGAAGFTDDGIPLMNEKLLLEAMERAKRLGLPMAFHEEDPALMKAPGVHQGSIRTAGIWRCAAGGRRRDGGKGLYAGSTHRSIGLHSAHQLEKFRGTGASGEETGS